MFTASTRLIILSLSALALLFAAGAELHARSGSPERSAARTITLGGGYDASLYLDEERMPEERTLATEVLEGAPFVYRTPVRMNETPALPESGPPYVPPRSSESKAGIAWEQPPAYSFLPSGLISIGVSAHAKKNASVLQLQLFAYGNEVGSLLETMESSNTRTVAALTSFFEKRTDPARVESLVKAAEEYKNLAGALRNFTEVPKEAAAIHAELATSLEAIASGLTRLTKQSSDEALVAAIRAYNAQSDAYLKKVLALATLMSAYEVSFSSGDAGAMFTFKMFGL